MPLLWGEIPNCAISTPVPIFCLVSLCLSDCLSVSKSVSQSVSQTVRLSLCLALAHVTDASTETYLSFTDT